jgi:hypothetical protein
MGAADTETKVFEYTRPVTGAEGLIHPTRRTRSVSVALPRGFQTPYRQTLRRHEDRFCQ